ncbi:MAG TPA: fumarylacetoacetate hydrolase family protein, partial [Acetobacteraceae bacterium]|nr:fumarylacetoacetate hydrolase family protein [Acetobacteraceae bacterium]
MAALRLISFTDGRGTRAGAWITGDRVVDLGTDMLALIEGGAAALSSARAKAEAASGAVPLASVRLEAPIPRPRRNVFCVGRNYMDHVAEGDRTRGITQSEVPKFPQFFTKAPDCVIAPGATVPSHANVTKWLDYEVELAAIIGKAGADIPKERALD